MTKKIYNQCIPFILIVLLSAFAAGSIFGAASALSEREAGAETLACSAKEIYDSTGEIHRLRAFAQKGCIALVSEDLQRVKAVNAAGNAESVSIDDLKSGSNSALCCFAGKTIERLRMKLEEKKCQTAALLCKRNGFFLNLNFCTITRLNNGDYLLLSVHGGDSAAKHFLCAGASLLALAVGAALFTINLSKRITKTLITPLQGIAEHADGSEFAVPFDELKSVKVYKELVPFVTTIKRQHEDIMRNANMRQEFTANVSHELKTPLTSISGYAEMIATGIAKEEDVQNFARRIHSESSRLLSLIADIIQLSELDYIEGRDDFENVDLLDLAHATENSLAPGAERYGIVISVEGEHFQTFGCRSQLEELIYNLCDNAIRYNKRNGKVSVTVFGSEGRPAISVEDTGIGIPEDKLDRVFERFFRVDKGRSKRTGGTGLGLAIVKHIALRHGAQISISSELGKGTKITVVFEENKGENSD